MSSIDEQLATIEARKQVVIEQKNKAYNELCQLQEEEQRLKQEKLAAEGNLTPLEILEFKRALSIVAGLVANEDVSFGGVYLKDEEPEETAGGYCGKETTLKYSFKIKTDYCYDVSPGLRVSVEVLTEDKAIAALVRAMVDSTEYVPDDEKDMTKNSWRVDWDYHDSVLLKGAVSSEEYWKQRKSLEKQGYVE